MRDYISQIIFFGNNITNMFFSGAGRYSRSGGADEVMPAMDEVAGKPVALTPLLDPRVNVNSNSALGVAVGVSDENWRVFPSNSLSQSNIAWSVNPPSNTCVSTLGFIQTSHTLAFAGTGSPLLTPAKEGPRSFALHSQIQTFNCSLNGTSASIDAGQLMDVLQRLISVDDLNETCSGSPVMADQYINYIDANSLGQARNPFAEVGNNDTQVSRAFSSHVSVNSVTNGNGSATVSLTLTEPIILSANGWSFSRSESRGFAGLQDININLVMGDLYRIWSRASDCNVLSSFTNTITSANLLLNFMTPSPLAPPINFQQAYQYPVMQISQQVTSAGTILNGASATLTSNVIETGNVPSKVLIYARRSNQTRNAGTLVSMQYTDTFARINSLSLQVNNRSALLSDFAPIALWRLSVRNGLRMSYQQWYKNCGGVVVVDFARDLGYVPASTERIQLQATMNVTNLGYTIAPVETGASFELYIVPFQPGVMTLKDHKCDISSALFSPADIARAMSQPLGDFNEFYRQQAYSGGNIFSSVGNWFNKAKDAVTPYLPLLRKALPYVPGVGQQADTALKAVGLGMVGGRKKKR
jgi:hypothetical protein